MTQPSTSENQQLLTSDSVIDTAPLLNPSAVQSPSQSHSQQTQFSSKISSFFGDNITYISQIPVFDANTMPLSDDSIKLAAKAGDWPSVVQICSRHIHLEPLRSKNVAWHVAWIQCLFQQRRYKEAHLHLIQIFGSIDIPQWVASVLEAKDLDTQPPQLVPFSTTILFYQILYKVNDPSQAIAKMHTLLGYLHQLELLIKKPIWKKRRLKATMILITMHFEQLQFLPAIKLTFELLQQYPNHPGLLSLLGRIYLQSGDIYQAKIPFEQLADAARSGWLKLPKNVNLSSAARAAHISEIKKRVHNILLLHQGLIYFSTHQYEKAAATFSTITTRLSSIGTSLSVVQTLNGKKIPPHPIYHDPMLTPHLHTQTSPNYLPPFYNNEGISLLFQNKLFEAKAKLLAPFKINPYDCLRQDSIIDTLKIVLERQNDISTLSLLSIIESTFLFS